MVRDIPLDDGATDEPAPAPLSMAQSDSGAIFEDVDDGHDDEFDSINLSSADFRRFGIVFPVVVVVVALVVGRRLRP